MPTTHLLYLHGFRSSPLSAKAQQMAAYVAQHHPQVHFWCPQLPPSPRAAMALVAEGVSQWPQHQMAVIGSSLGGFYASWIAQQCRCPSVMINPSVNPAQSLAHYIGEQTAWHNPEERFYFQPAFIDELRTLSTAHLPPASRELVLIAKGDEVLNWRDMAARYVQADCRIFEGGDHALSDFAEHLDSVGDFLTLA